MKNVTKSFLLYYLNNTKHLENNNNTLVYRLANYMPI